jgi:uroporphyrinogen decarboxylase
MDTLTGIERISNILHRRPVDRIGLFEHFWNDTQRAWTEQGHIRAGENLADHFGFDMSLHSPFTMTADLDVQPEIVEETEETILTRDGNGALLRRHKLHEATPEHVDFRVRDRATWEELARPHLLEPDERRIDFAGYREAKAYAQAHDRFFAWSGVNVFELMHPVCGHQYMLMGMALDPDWIKDMVSVYSTLTVRLQEILFEREGWPDGIWYYEDMGFKGRPFMSPAMYREIIQPGHIHTIDYAKSHGRPVVMHSCGMVEKLLPGMVEAGIDCLQVIEVKAGMDLLKLYREYGDRLSFMGGIDVRTLYSNDRDIIDEELQLKIPVVKGNCGYVLHSDHSIPNTVDYESYQYFVGRGMELGRYDR